MRCSSQRFRQVARCVCRSLQNLACIQTRPSRTTTARAWRRPVVTESGCASQAIGMTEFCVAPCPVPQVREAVLRIATSSPCRIASECSHRERRPRLCRLTIPRSNVTSARGAHLRERSAERDGGNGGGASRAVFVQLGDQRGTPVAPSQLTWGVASRSLLNAGHPCRGLGAGRAIVEWCETLAREWGHDVTTGPGRRARQPERMLLRAGAPRACGPGSLSCSLRLLRGHAGDIPARRGKQHGGGGLLRAARLCTDAARHHMVRQGR
jgi:hypothetical protein